MEIELNKSEECTNIQERNHVQDLQSVLDILKGFDDIYKDLHEEVGQLDKDLCDQVHNIENTKFDAYKGYLIAKKLKETRQQRRKAKNEMALLQPIHDWISRNKGIEIDLFKIKKSMERIKFHQDNWVYNPRIPEDD